MARPKIYVASSFRNLHAVKLLNQQLREKGFHVLDWTEKAPPVSDLLTPEQKRAELDKDIYGEIFTFCRNACGQADAVIYLGAAGQDAGVEIGMAHASGILIYGLAGSTESPGTMLNGCVERWFNEPAELVEALFYHFKDWVFFDSLGRAD